MECKSRSSKTMYLRRNTKWMNKLKGWKFFIQKGMKFRLGFGETNKKKGSSKKTKSERKNFVSVFRVCKTGAARGVKKTKKKSRRELAFCCWFVTSRRSLKELGSETL
jgi:hypothetical protein